MTTCRDNYKTHSLNIPFCKQQSWSVTNKEARTKGQKLPKL